MFLPIDTKLCLGLWLMTHQNIGEEKKRIIIMEHNHGFLKGKIHQKEKN
jgi:hypothetical protein